MNSFDALCKCFDEQAKSCCDPPAPKPAAPIVPQNPPGLSVIRYRIGTFTTFRRAMLDDLALLSRTGPDDAFARWHEGTDGDYQTMFVELWAYLADVLTFYQERIANEAFLPTATQRDSLVRLCRLIDYRPNPGAGASALLAFTVEENKTVLIPAGFRAGNKPTPGKEPAVFETETAFFALGAHSAIAMASAAPTNQFAPLRDFEVLAKTPTAAQATEAAATIYPSAGDTYLKSFISSSLAQTVVGFTARSASIVPSAPANGKITRPIVLKGTNTRLAAGDYVLIVERNEKPPTLRRLDSVQPDKATASTRIHWTEEDSSIIYENVTLFALRVTANPFGSSAPAWNTLSPTLREEGGAFPNSWDNKDKDDFFIPDLPDEGVSAKNILYLDATYAEAKRSESHHDWVVLVSKDVKPGIFHVADVQTVIRSGFTIVAKVTRLTLRSDEEIPHRVYPLRTTVILTGAERLTLQDSLPLPEPLAGNTLILAGQYPLLEAGQRVVVRGKRIDASASDPPTAEEAVLKDKPEVSPNANITKIVLTADLQGAYMRASTVLLANVTSATQGETVKDEVLGSGNGSELQTFTLKKKPLTYLPSADAEGLSAVKSTLQVTVNGVRWSERPTLFQHPADAQEYTTSLDETGQATVSFGDGVFGAKPPTGKDNVRARYRKGMGTNGNVAGNAVAQPLDSIPGLQKVTNPQPTHGGLDQEQIDQIRNNAPASLRTFGRAVSARDYADLATIFPGVAKASAEWVERDPATGRILAQPHVRLIVATAEQAPLASQQSFTTRLREFLDRRRDPNVPLRLSDCTKILIEVKVRVAIDDDYPRNATTARVLAALNPTATPGRPPGYFAFERLQFGQSIHLSDLYRTIQAIEGVRDAVVTLLRRKQDPVRQILVRETIFIGPTELAELQNDPNDVAKELVTWHEGGFVDT